VPHTIKLKIDLRRFLPLSNIKYLPAFAGKIELRLYFSTQGLVISNRDPKWYFYDKSSDFSLYYKYTTPKIHQGFVQIWDTTVIPISDTVPTTGENGNGTIGRAKRIITVARDFVVTLCETNISCFGLSQVVYDGLVSRYSQKVLTFPTQTIQFSNMSSKLTSASAKAVQAITPRFVDSIFLLFPVKSSNRSVFYNPGFMTFQLGYARYGQFPSIAFGTNREPRLIEMTTNALNLNSDTCGLSCDVLVSLIYAESSNIPSQTVQFKSSDRSNFLIGIPTEIHNTFQQGQTSNTPINYELTVTQNASNWYAQNVSTTPVIGVLSDSTFNIMVNSNGQPPIVTLGLNDITSPVLT
jgi:hypothetical protein